MTTPMRENVAAWPSSSPALRPHTNEQATDPIRLIFVDDDDDYREAATGELVDLGFSVEGFRDGADMLKSVADGVDADVIVLDWGLPAVTGIDLLPRLRRQGILLPVVFLTGRATLAHENLAFDRGALDFVDKSRGVPILAKRLRLIVEPMKRPVELEVEETMHCGRLMLKPRVSRAFWNDVDVNLTLTEFNIVRLLSSNVGNHVTYRAVYDCMHHVGFIAGSGEYGYRTNVRSSIKRIRNKFRAVDADFGEIENYPSFGYRWGRNPSAETELVGEGATCQRVADP
jgi:two-component system, OmpR family, response regulator ChvI